MALTKASVITFWLLVSLGILTTGLPFTSLAQAQLSPSSALSYCAGSYQICAVLDNKKVKCYGSMTALGLSSAADDSFGDSPKEFRESLPYVEIGNNVNAVSIACGSSFICIQAETNEIKCLGNNEKGQLGLEISTSPIGLVSGHIGDSLPLVNLGAGVSVLDLALGLSHSCVKITGNQIKCYGNNEHGQLGLGHTNSIGNGVNQMGDNLATVDLGTGVEVFSVHSGPFSEHTCIIIDKPVALSQRVKCWGLNAFNQLGYGDSEWRGDNINEMGDNLQVIDLGTESKVKMIAVGGSHTCMILYDGKMKCWGYGLLGQLGSGRNSDISSTGDDLPTMPIDYTLPIKQITAGLYYTCILFDDQRTLKCFGSSSRGKLEQDDKIQRGDSPFTKPLKILPINFGFPKSMKIVSIVSGMSVNCAYLSNSSIRCLKMDTHEYLEVGSVKRIGAYETKNEKLSKKTSVFRRLSTPTLVPTLAPILEPTQTPTRLLAGPIKGFCTGNYFACSLFSNNKIKCWGYEKGWGSTAVQDYNDLALTELGNSLPYVDFGTDVVIKEVHCGGAHVCVKLNNDDLKCRGRNTSGQIGIGQIKKVIGAGTGHVGDNLPVVNLGNGVKAINVALGDNHSCVVVTGNKVKCYGANDSGNLGYSDTIRRGRSTLDMGDNLGFVDLGTGVEVDSVHSGSTCHHNCVILSAPTVSAQRIKCWGRNDAHQLGYGDTNNRGDTADEMGDNLGLLDLGIESNAKQLALGQFHTCALLIDDILKCVGSGAEGQIASGSTSDISSTGYSLPPVEIDSEKTISLLSAGYKHTCILYNDMIGMKCFGNNNVGQLGQGDKLTRGQTPSTTVPTIPYIDLGTGTLKISSIHSGAEFNCVVFIDASVKCFGDNKYSELAMGDFSNRGDDAGEMGSSLQFAKLFSTIAPTFAPTQSPTESPAPKPPAPIRAPIISFCTGEEFACAVFIDNQVKCWGNQKSWGRTSDSGYSDTTPTELGSSLPYINFGTNVGVKEVYCGGHHICVKLKTDDLKCLGENFYGQLGLGINTTIVGEVSGHIGDNLPTVNLGTELKVINVALGYQHTCAVVTGNQIKCFGYNSRGQLGYGHANHKGELPSDMGDNLPFVDLGTGLQVKTVYSGPSSSKTCASIMTDSTGQHLIAKCWGRARYDYSGYTDKVSIGDAPGEMGDNLPSINLRKNDKIKKIAVGGDHTCIIFKWRRFICFGLGSSGQLGTGSVTSITLDSTLVQLDLSDTAFQIFDVTAGMLHTCILYADKVSVRCFGSNNVGQLGQGDRFARGYSPSTTISSIPYIDLGTETLKIKSLHSGSNFNCVVFEDASVKCFGANKYGQLGIADLMTKGDEKGEMGNNLQFAQLLSGTNSPTQSPSRSPTFSPIVPTNSGGPSNSPTALPTKLPTTEAPTQSPITPAPTHLPTRLPTRLPTTEAPTQSPITPAPTRNPTKKPTQPTPRVPTSNPTRKPTAYGFFGALESSLPFGLVKAFDLYLLIDTTKNYENANVYCQQYKLLSGASPLSCLDLLLDYAIGIVSSISVATNGYYSNDLSKGLRVQASLIQCIGSQKAPAFVQLFPLTGDSTVIMNGLNNARTNIQLTEAGSCPLYGMYDVIQKIESSWINVPIRPYKSLITLTDAIATGGTSLLGYSLINAVSAVRFRCTPSLVIVPYKITDGSISALNQQLALKVLTGNIPLSAFEAKNAPWMVIPTIGLQVTQLLRTYNNLRCLSPLSFATFDKYWCGYNHPIICAARPTCQWLLTPIRTCQKNPAQSGCVYFDQTLCNANTNCQWNTSTNACNRKPEEPDCNAFFIQTLCNSKSNFCSWTGSTCVSLSG